MNLLSGSQSLMAKSSIVFANKVYEIVESIPSGKVMTYGQIAALADNAGAARIVGKVIRMGNTSLDIKVDIYIELMNSDKRELAISGLFKFVAVGEDKKPIKIDINKIDN